MPFDVNQRLPEEDAIRNAAERNGVPFDAFKNLIYIESRGNASAQSVADTKGRRAWGLGQLRGPAMQDMGLSWEDRLDPVKNADASARYYGRMLKAANGDTTLAGLMYFKGAGSDDVTHYQNGDYNLISAEGKQRVSAMSGTGKKLPSDVLAHIPETGTGVTTPDMGDKNVTNPIGQQTIGNIDLSSQYNPEYKELPTLEAQHEAAFSGQRADESAPFLESVGKSFHEAYVNDGGYEIAHAGDHSQTWNSAAEFERRIMGWAGDTNANTYLSPETVKMVKDQLNYQNYGLTHGRTDAEVRAMLPVWVERQNEQKLQEEHNVQTGTVGSFVGGMAGGMTSPQGIAATVATAGVAGGVNMLYRGVATGITKMGVEGIISKSMMEAVHPVIQTSLNAAGKIAKSSVAGAIAGGSFGYVNEAGRQAMGYYHTDTDLKDAVISNAQFGALLGGGMHGVWEAAKIPFARRALPEKTMEEATGGRVKATQIAPTTPLERPVSAPEQAPVGEPTPTAKEIVGPSETVSEVSQMSQKELEENAAQLMTRGELKKAKSEIHDHETNIEQLKKQMEEVTAQKVKGSGKELAKGRSAKAAEIGRLNGLINSATSALEQARNSIKEHVEGGKYHEASRALSRAKEAASLRNQVEKLTGEHAEMIKEHDFLESTKGEKPRKGMTKRLNNLKKQIAEHAKTIAQHQERLNQIRGGKQTVYTRHSEVSPSNRQNLKDVLGMSDENIDRITNGQAVDYLNRHTRAAEEAAKLHNKTSQSVDAVANGVQDPAFTNEHKAGRDLYHDGERAFTVEGDTKIEDFPEKIPDVKMAEGTVLSGNNPLNPIRQAVETKIEQKVNNIRPEGKPVGLLKKGTKAFGNIFVNFRDLASVIYDSNVKEIGDKARAYATHSAGEVVNGKHSMFRADGNATMEDIIRIWDGLANNRNKALQVAERAFSKEFENASLSVDEIHDKMGLMVTQAIEDTTGKLYEALPDSLKPAVDAVRTFNTQAYDMFNNLDQFNNTITPEEAAKLRSSIDPNNYFTRSIDENNVGVWAARANELFDRELADIHHENLMSGYDTNPEIRRKWKEEVNEDAKEAEKIIKNHAETIKRAEAKVNKIAEEHQRLVEKYKKAQVDPSTRPDELKQMEQTAESLVKQSEAAVKRLDKLKDQTEEIKKKSDEIKASLDETKLRASYSERAKEYAEAVQKLDPHHDEVLCGNTLDWEEGEINLSDFGEGKERVESDYKPYEAAKMMKQRFPMDTSHETLLRGLDGSTHRFSFDTALRNVSLTDNLHRYDRVMGSELANRAVNKQSFAAEMMELEHLKSKAKKIVDLKERKKAIRSIEALQTLQMVYRKSPRVKQNNAVSKVAKLVQNSIYYGANWSFGIQNTAEMGLTNAAYLKSMITRDLPQVFEIDGVKFGQLTKKQLNSLTADLVTGEVHRQLQPRLSVARESNRIAFDGDSTLSRMFAKAEYTTDSMLHNQAFNKLLEGTTDLAYKEAQKVGANIAIRDAILGKERGKYRGERYLDSYRISPEEYENMLEMLRSNITVDGTDVRFRDMRKFNNSREGANFRKMMEMHGREGIQVQMPGQQTFMAQGQVMKTFMLFKDFARRSINRSRYLWMQGHYNQRKGQMALAATLNSAAEAANYTLRTYINAQMLPKDQRDAYWDYAFNAWTPIEIASRNPMAGALNAVRLPLSMVGLDPFQKVRQTAGYAAPSNDRWDSVQHIQSSLGKRLVGANAPAAFVLNGIALPANVARSMMDWGDYAQRNRDLDDIQHNLRALSTNNPIVNVPASKAINALRY